MFVMRAAVGVEANPWTGGKVALAHKEISNTAEVSRKVREDSILREIRCLAASPAGVLLPLFPKRRWIPEQNT
jgi:hypothetical protein